MSLIKNCGLAVAIASFSQPLLAQANTIELYVDTKTQQLFAEPGEGRIKLGNFRRADDNPVVPTPQLATAAPVAQPAAASPNRNTNVNIRGYVQARHSSILAGDKGVDLWTDRSVGDRNSIANDSFLIRRGRLVFSGDRGDHVHFYIQPDFASAAGTTGNVLQLRDAYVDLHLNKDKVHRFRVGQSKVPYGFENLQSSQNRLTLDRADAMNSAVRDERDTGIFYYYTPTHIQQRFAEIAQAGLKHSGNYGMFGLGLYNGQGANRRDVNDTLHTVARATWPMKTNSGQFYEVGVQGYTGKFVPGTASFTGSDGMRNQVVANSAANDERFRRGFTDERIGISAIMYPQPFGLQAEWNWGTTPGLDNNTRRIEETSLNGGYLQAMYKHDTGKESAIIPFAKWQYFDGANKAENNAPRNRVNDWELGVEWQLNRQIELTAVYHMMNRNNLLTGNRADLADFARFDSDALRLQLQVSY